MAEQQIAEVFGKIVGLACELGARDIYRLPGCWEHAVDESWWVAVNGHEQKVKCSRGAFVPPFAVYIEFNGFPAGFCDAGGGTLAAGAIANEDALIEALDKATENAKAKV